MSFLHKRVCHKKYPLFFIISQFSSDVLCATPLSRYRKDIVNNKIDLTFLLIHLSYIFFLISLQRSRELILLFLIPVFLNVHVLVFFTASTNPFSRSRPLLSCQPVRSLLLFQRALCCFPGFSNPGTASRKGKIPKPLLAGVDSTGTSSTVSSKSRLLDDSSGTEHAVVSPSIIELASAAARLKGTITRLSDGKQAGEDMMLLEKQGRSSQRQRMQEGEPRRAGSLPPSSLPRPPRTLKSTANSRYCRLSDTETRKKSDPGPVSLDSSSTAMTTTTTTMSGSGTKITRDFTNCSSIEYGRFDAKASRKKKSTMATMATTSAESFVTSNSLKKSSPVVTTTTAVPTSGAGCSGSGHEYERLQSDNGTITGRKKSVTGNGNNVEMVKHRELQSRSFIPPPSRRIGEYGRLSDGDSPSSSSVVKAGTLRKAGQMGGGSSRAQSTGSTVSSKSGGARDSGGTASSEASTASLPPVKARSIPRPSNYRIQF